jgi:hypothetical protein
MNVGRCDLTLSAIYILFAKNESNFTDHTFYKFIGKNQKFQEYWFLHPEHAKTRLRASVT